MTVPFDYTQQTHALSGELDQAAAGSEWSSFMAKRKELLDAMLQTAMPEPPPPGPVDPQGNPTTQPVAVAPGATLQPPTPEMLGQAQFWGIPGADKMSAAELQHEIDQRRAEVPREQRTSLQSALFAGGAAAASAAGAAAQLTERAFENVGGALDNIPFVGPALSSILNSDKSKLALETLQSRAGEAVEAARSMQPPQDNTAFQFLTGAGKMAGYALPAIAAWEGLGAAAGMPRLAWLAQGGTPLMRLAAKGALTSALFTDPNAPLQEKVLDIGLGAVMGGAQMWSPAGAALALGGIGAGVGAAIGDTPEARRQHAIEMGLGAALLGGIAGTAGMAFARVRQAFPDGTLPPEDIGGVGAEQQPPTPPGESPAEWWFEPDDKPQISGNPVPQSKMLGAGQPLLPSGSTEPQTAADMDAIFRSQPTMQLDENGVPQVVEQAQSAMPAPQTAGLLAVPPQTNIEGDSGYASLMRDHDHFMQALSDEGYRVDHGYPADLTAPYQGEAGGPTTASYLQAAADTKFSLAQAEMYNDRAVQTLANRGFAEVTQGPAHLIGSKVAAADGTPLSVYHGTAAAFGDFDPQLLDAGALYGPGIYHTESADIANGYANTGGILTSGLYSPDQIPPSLAPNVRPSYLDIRNPFDIDKNYSLPEAHAIVDQLAAKVPGFDWDATRMFLESPTLDPAALRAGGTISSDDLYNELAMAHSTEPQQGQTQVMGGYEVGPAQVLGKAGLNNALQQIGYDGITHIGGQITGNQPHRVWIALRADQVHPVYARQPLEVSSAQDAAEAITKQATVMASSTLPDAIAQVQLGDPEVVKAAQAANPGGTAIVRGVGRSLDVLAQHPDVQFVQRGNKLDALVGPFTQTQIDQYTRYGTYEGNKVVSAGSGIEGTVRGINSKGFVTIERTGGGPPLRVKAENLLPSRYGEPVYEGRDLWPSFKADLLHYLNEQSSRAGMAPVESLWDPRVTDQMQAHLEDYLNRRGITDAGTRHAIDVAINNSFVEEAKDLDPEAKELQSRLGDEATIETNSREASDEPVPVSLEEKAESRGFIWLSRPGADGGILRDGINPEGAFEMPMNTDAAAEEFIHNVDRTMPDITPASDVPFEVMESVPVNTEWEPQAGAEEAADNIVDDNEYGDAELDRVDAAAGGSGVPPGPPPEPAAATPELPPEQPDTLGSQFARLRREDPTKFAALQRKWAGNNFRYTRYLMANLENTLQHAGVDLARPWRDITDMETARTKADNEAYDWHREATQILRKFPKALMRSGFVSRTMEIGSPAVRAQRWDDLAAEGYSLKQIAQMKGAEAELTDFYNRLLGSQSDQELSYDQARQVLRYISTLRMRQAQGLTDDKLWDASNILSPELQFFAEHARANNLQFRVSDVRSLTNHLIRSLMFSKYQTEAYQNLVDTWSDRRIPENFRALMLDHAYSMRFGYKPENTMAVKAIRGMVEGVAGVPITTEEASRFAGLLPGWMYRSMLAGRTSIFFRDSTQPLIALAKVRAGFMKDAYGQVLKYWREGAGRDQLMADYAKALQHGWVARNRAPIEAMSAFENQPGSDQELLGLTPEQVAKRERVARVGDALAPHWLSKLDDVTNTLRYYGRLNDLNQFIVGQAAYKQAIAGLGEFRQMETQAALRGDPSLAMDYQTFARKSFFSSFQPAVSQHLQDLVQNGDDEEAAATFAREVTKWSQFVYTNREKPAPLRQGFGRLAAFFGNFTGQFLEGAIAAAKYGEPAHRARALMVLGGISYGLAKLGQKLGLRNLSNWAWTASLRYAGSPILELASQASLAYGGIMAGAENRSPSELQKTAIQQIPSVTEAATEFFPYTGYLRSAGAIQEASQGPTPARDIATYLVTGDKGSNIQFLLDQQSRAADFAQRYDTLTHTLRPRPTGSLSPNGGTVHPAQPVPSPVQRLLKSGQAGAQQ